MQHKGEPQNAARVGAVLGGTYRLERLIGEGGMGSVYEASHLRVPRKFAVKLLNPDVIGNREVFDRFRREAELTSSLGHENIVQVFDFNHTDDGVPYMVLELLSGEDLSSRIKTRGRMTIEQVTRVLEQICSGLEAAHAAGIVHRDLKPQNLFLIHRGSRDDVVKILDFGISKVLHQPTSGTKTGLIMGTPNYMSPEQAEGRQSEIDARTDIFALGTIVYECLTARMVFDAPTPVGTIYQICHGIPDPIRAYAPEVSDVLERVIMYAISKRRDERYQTVNQFWNDWQKAVTGREVPTAILIGSQPSAQQATMALGGRPTTMSGSAGQIVNGPVGGTMPPASYVQPRKSRAGLWATLGLLVVGGGVAAGVLATRGGDTGTTTTQAGVTEPAGTPAETPPETPVGKGAPETPVEKPEPSARIEAPPVKEKVSFRFEVKPAGATVEVDGVAIPTDAPLELDKGDATIKLRVSADGYVDEVREVRATTGGVIKIELDKEKKAASSSSKPKKKKNIGPVEDEL